MIRLSSFFFSTLSVLSCFSQEGNKIDYAQKYAQTITDAELKTHLTVLASDEYEGRETGKSGQKKAAEYLINSFKKSGCSFAPGMNQFEQQFNVIENVPGGSLNFLGKELSFKTDFIYTNAKAKNTISNLPVYTTNAAQLHASENIVIVEKLVSTDVRGAFLKIKEKGLVTSNVKAIVLVAESFSDVYMYYEHFFTSRSMRLASDKTEKELPIIIVNSESVKDKLPKKLKYLFGKGKPKTYTKELGKLSAELNKDEQLLQSSNVLAFIPGSDPILSKEVVVITAHYDHIGIDNGVVYNGADDDGTGTVALLELAQAFMTAYKEGNGPRRSILIMPVSGEEKGLLGSRYYTENPIIPLANIISDLNIDMIGRDDIPHENTKEEYIYIIGSNMISDDLHNANELANNSYTNLKLDYTFNSKNDPNQFYYRSDHYNFAKNGIPSVFYFSGVHDDYHQPTDDVEKIDFEKVETVAKLVFHTAWILANKTERPAPNE